MSEGKYFSLAKEEGFFQWLKPYFVLTEVPAIVHRMVMSSWKAGVGSMAPDA